MYHTQEILNLEKPNQICSNDSTPKFSNEPPTERKRFGEVAVGSLFVYCGITLRKTGDRTAKSSGKRDIREFIFGKGDVVGSYTSSDVPKTQELYKAAFTEPTEPYPDEERPHVRKRWLRDRVKAACYYQPNEICMGTLADENNDLFDYFDTGFNRTQENCREIKIETIPNTDRRGRCCQSFCER